MSLVRDTGTWDLATDVLVVGAGGCGLAAGIAAAQGGAGVLVLEKSTRPLSNTARSGGMIPAAGTRLQRRAGIEEGPEEFAADILRKNRGGSDPVRTLHLCRTAVELVHWLADEAGVTLTLVDDFTYPGHRRPRMHAPPGRTGQALIDDLRRTLRGLAGAELVTGAGVEALVADASGAVTGAVARQGGQHSRIAARKVILACNGFAGNRALLARYCPRMIDALYFGGEGSTGEGIVWGQELGAAVAFLDAYQAHATVAVPHAILITYAVIMEGGMLVNRGGHRFGDETQGYSEFALEVLAQPEGLAWAIYDERIHRLAGAFEDYREAEAAGAVLRAGTVEALAARAGIAPAGLAETVRLHYESCAGDCPDRFARRWRRALEPPFCAVKVTGALFHTQGGLVVDEYARVLRDDGSCIPNLYAGGGVAAGLSGHGPGGYLSGNGLLTALGYGMLAGRHAAAACAATR